MITSIYFQICSIFYVILLNGVFFLKKRINLLENKAYGILIISNLVGLLLDIFSVFTIIYKDKMPFINLMVTKLYLIYLLTWILSFTIYVFIISTKSKRNYHESFIEYLKHNVFFVIIYVVSCIVIMILPLYYYNENSIVYSYGPSANFLYLISGVCIASWLIILIRNIQNVKKIKCLPIFAYIAIGGFVMVVQNLNPQLLLMTSMETFCTFLMYFTIENPDVKMIEQLNIARDQADKANNAKTEFLSSMSHEIRTPLNAIVGFSQALLEEDLPQQAEEEVKDIVMASDTLLDLVNGILDISKIEANKLEIVNVEYNFNQVLEELVSLTKARLGEKPLDFRVEFDQSLPKYLYGDKVRVKQIILNLLTNAVKYTHEGWIAFKVNSVIQGDVCRLIISVQDTGIGIKPESIDKLFSKFERLDIEKNNTIEGTGLGLAITKKLLNLMGGQVVVQSTYGEGSKFTIALDQKIVTSPTNPNLETTQTLDLSAIKTVNLTNKRILIVDDNKINLKVAARLLQDYHCIIDTLESGIECLDKIKMGASYDLILMDDMMPKMSGVETFHNLKEIEGFNTPVVALTANAISGMREKYLSEGFDDYLSKPIDKTELRKVLNKFFN